MVLKDYVLSMRLYVICQSGFTGAKLLKTLSLLVKSNNLEVIYVAASPNPELKANIASLSEICSVQMIDDTPFVSPKTEPDIKRFFRYWNKTKKLALQKQGGVTA